jgi:hypothetical protein
MLFSLPLKESYYGPCHWLLFLSAALDNLTTTILMISLLKKTGKGSKRKNPAKHHGRCCCQCRGSLDSDWRCHYNNAMD